MVASRASHRRAALARTAMNTGWTSVGELERLGQHAIFRPLPLQTLRQALLQFATLGGFLLRRLAGDRSPGFNLSLCGLCSPTHRPLLTSYRRYDRAEIDDRLGERALVGKSKVEYSMLRASVQ